MKADWQGGQALVTGGAGFIGSHLVDALLAAGVRVRVLDDFSAGQRGNLAAAGDRVEVIEGTIVDPEVCRSACAGADWVFHQAARGSVPRSLRDPAGTIAVNVTGTANVLAAARDAGVRRVVYASSSSVYGDSDRLPKIEGEEGEPLSPYALSKRMNESLAVTFGRCFGLETIGLRYFNIYGPRQRPDGPYAAVIPRFFDAFRSGTRPTIHGDGAQSRDFTFVADAVRANLAAAQAPVAACGRAYNVGRGERTTIADLARRIAACVGTDASPEHGPPRAGDVAHSLADPAAIRTALAFEPRVTLDDGLATTLKTLS